MNEADDPDVKIPMVDDNPVGDVEKLTVQTGNRVLIPKEWLEHHDLEEGDDILIVCREDGVEVMEWSLDKLTELRDELNGAEI